MSKIPKVKFFKHIKNKFGFEIKPLQHLFLIKDSLDQPLNKPHRIQFHLIIFITKGSGVHFIDFQPYNYYEGSTLFISKGQIQAFKINPETEGFIILFTEAFLLKNLIHSDLLSLYKLYNSPLQSPVLQHEDIGKNSFSNILNAMLDEYNHTNDFAKEEILRSLLKAFLLKAERVKQTLIPKRKNTELFIDFVTFKNNIEKHSTKTRNAKEYAKMMNCSYKRLNQICRFATGSTAKHFIDKYVVLEIKRHIATSDISIKELSYLMGFDEPTNLVKYFKKHTNQSPSQFRKTISQ